MPHLPDDVLGVTPASISALQVAAEMIPEAASHVEHATAALTDRFKELASTCQQQSDTIKSLTCTIGNIPVEGKTITLEDFVQLFSSTLDDAISKMLVVSKKALQMVYNMEDAITHLNEIEKF